MIAVSESTRVYLAQGATDLRKSIDALSVLVADVLKQDPFSCHLFVFCNRARDKIKILLWQHNGFWLFYRRLERERFRWPAHDGQGVAVTVSRRELRWLLDGLDYRCIKGHRKAEYRLL
jgi:transposase